MTIDELFKRLNDQSSFAYTGGQSPVSYDQIIQAIQGQYTAPSFDVSYSPNVVNLQSQQRFADVAMPSQKNYFNDVNYGDYLNQALGINQPQSQMIYEQIYSPASNAPVLQYMPQIASQPSGAQRFINGQTNFEQPAFVEYGRKASTAFTPGVFDIEQYRAKPPTVEQVVNTIGGDSSGASPVVNQPNYSPASVGPDGSVSTGLGGFTLGPDGMAVPNTINPAAATLASMVLGLPLSPINTALNTNATNAANAFNQSTSDTMGVNANVTSPAATAGTAGTGGNAADAAQAAAAFAASLGYSDAAIGAASQAAADAVIGGASPEAAAQAAAVAAADAVGYDFGYGDSGSVSSSAADAAMSDAVSNAAQAEADAGFTQDSWDAGQPDYSSSDSSSSSSSKIICTAMNHTYGFGSFRNSIWIAYADKHLTKAHEVGYHTLFMPLVDYGFKRGNGRMNLAVRKFLEWGARHRSTDLRAEMRGTKRDAKGRIFRLIFEPLCFVVGKLKGY